MGQVLAPIVLDFPQYLHPISWKLEPASDGHVSQWIYIVLG
jgi:hypothetical protein